MMQSEGFSKTFKKEISFFEEQLKRHWDAFPREDIAGIRKLLESVEYSLLVGGKRFRPVLGILVAEALETEPIAVAPFAIAVEMIHTYSLIHDDLPAMDNDDVRRGKATNHKVFGEAMALLAGDGLMTEAFAVLAEAYAEEPELVVNLVTLLARAAGLRGMVGGQAIDIVPMAGPKEEWEVRYAHNLKTGALIKAVVDGAALIGDADDRIRHSLAEYGKSVGLAFQVADDLQDDRPGRSEPNSFVTVLGKEKTRRLLKEVTDQALAALADVGLDQTRLAEVARFNFERA